MLGCKKRACCHRQCPFDHPYLLQPDAGEECARVFEVQEGAVGCHRPHLCLPGEEYASEVLEDTLSHHGRRPSGQELNRPWTLAHPLTQTQSTVLKGVGDIALHSLRCLFDSHRFLVVKTSVRASLYHGQSMLFWLLNRDC